MWYIEYPTTININESQSASSLQEPRKVYIDSFFAQTIGSGKTDNLYLAIYDNIMLTAKLRKTAYLNFEDLYLPANQGKLQVLNFELSNNIIAWSWSRLQKLDPTGFFPQAPFALYNWELLYHTPLLIAELLAKHQRFADAQKWLHYIFNPTKPDSADNVKEAAQFWQFLPFRKLTTGDDLQKLFELLAEKAANFDIDPEKRDELAQFTTLIADWRENPFLPFRIARVPARWQSFEWRVIFAYLDNLIAWGDQLFRRFTRESINEAIQCYILALKLLGPRPKAIKSQSQLSAQSYRDLYGKWDDFSNAWYQFDGPVSTMLLPPSIKQGDSGYIRDDRTYHSGAYFEKYGPSILSSLPMLYFCIPPNNKLIDYWDAVEERLGKIRACQDIDGIPRKLPLFAPRIDPLLLVRATAAGVDLDTVLADMDAPLLPYRFYIIVQKANEICAEVKSLGAALLTALEKKDAEALALLRAGQEVAILNLITQTKQQQVQEANATIESLNQSSAIAMERFTQYQRLLGKPVTVDSDGLPLLSVSSSLQVPTNAPGEEAGLGLVQYEIDQISSLEEAHKRQEGAGIASTVAGILHAMPESQNGGIYAYVHMGGTHLGNAANAVASYLSLLSANANYEASRKGLFASYQRRQDEWVHQSKLALEEMKQINKQISAARIRLDIAQTELNNHLKQIDNAQAVDDFMHDKYTNQELYSWMSGQISNVYFTCYQLAYDTAKRAEKAFQYERGLETSNFIQYGYWDSLKKGLIAGESLSLDLKRMEVAYLEHNTRELEITRHVSLLQLDSLALIKLKETGCCEIMLPEALFDMDFPGHYFRRIKTVSLTIPCVVGPYTSVNCTLTLLENSVRVKPDGQVYKKTVQDDPRFRDSQASIQSIAISSGQNDSGLFELNFRDERYLPFEGAGAISTWRLELSGKWQDPNGQPIELAQFDFDTISDVILHMRYTARDGGQTLKQKVVQTLQESINEFAHKNGAHGMVQFFSLRHMFPTEWQRFIIDPKEEEHSQAFSLTKERFPFIFQGRKLTITSLDLYGVLAADTLPNEDQSLTLRLTTPNAKEVQLQDGAIIGQLMHKTGDKTNEGQKLKVEVKSAKANQSNWILTVEQNDLSLLADILILCHYQVGDS